MPRVGMIAAGACALVGFGMPLQAAPATNAFDLGTARVKVVPVEWQNVCRERVFLRRDHNGRLVAVQGPSCTQVWIGRRYFSNGRYYADPGFATPIN